VGRLQEKIMCTLKNYLSIIFVCLCLTASYARGGAAGLDSTKTAIVVPAGDGSGATEADSAAAPKTALPGALDTVNPRDVPVPLMAADSAFTQDSGGESEAARMYRSSLSRMRRDAPQMNAAPDTLLKKRKMIPAEPEGPKLSEPKRADSLSPVAKSPAPVSSPPSKTKVKKSSIAVAVGSCALIGCGIAVYLLTNSKKDDAVSRNNPIPPPPDPPL
jgi:hypothetical protein